MVKKKFGLLLRSYAKNASDVPEVVARAVNSINHAIGLCDENGKLFFTDILVTVPRNYDCGNTGRAISRELPSSLLARKVSIFEINGHHSCGVLNYGIDILERRDVDFVLIVSHKAIEALTVSTMKAIREAFDNGAKEVGVAVDEIQGAVLSGRIQNTFSGWEIKALQAAGGFDSEIGVEEIAPTVRLIRKYGQCIAVLHPAVAHPLDIRKSADGQARHSEVMNTKIRRQIIEVERLSVDFSFIKAGVMSGYPKVV